MRFTISFLQIRALFNKLDRMFQTNSIRTIFLVLFKDLLFSLKCLLIDSESFSKSNVFGTPCILLDGSAQWINYKLLEQRWNLGVKNSILWSCKHWFLIRFNDLWKPQNFSKSSCSKTWNIFNFWSISK